MQKTIQFSGHTAVPSDHDAPDGTLAQAFNLSADTDLGLQPVGEPITIGSPRQGWTARYIHNLPSGEDTVIYLGSDNKLAFAIMANENVGELVTIDGPELSGCEPQSIQFTSIGNILIAHSQELSMQYYLWRGDSYQALGNRPGFPVLEFGLKKIAGLNDSIEIQFPVSKEEVDSYRGFIANGNGYNKVHGGGTSGIKQQSPIESLYEHITNALYGKIYEFVHGYVKDNNYIFYQPFMLRYAVCLFDGTYAWHSSPMLMLPTTCIPKVSAAEFEYNNDILRTHASFQSLNLFKLRYRLLQFQNFEAWKDIVSSIDVFVSSPIYTYEQSEQVEGYGDLMFGKIDYTGRGRDDKSECTHHRIEGIYSEQHDDVPYQRIMAEDKLQGKYWRLPDRTSKLESDIRDCHLFYRIARLEFDDILSGLGGELKDLPLEDGIDYSNLVTRPTLPDDFGSHRTLYPGVSHIYNNRLNLAGSQALPPAALPIRSCLTYTNENPRADTAQKAIITRTRVAFKKNNRTYYRETTGATGSNEYSPWLIDTFGPDKPLYLFVSDRDAYEITFWYRQGEVGPEQSVSYKLRPHDFLNGAYYFAGIFVPAQSTAATQADSEPAQPLTDTTDKVIPNQRYIRQNQLYTSQANNPFVFPPLNATTVGNGTIIALASAAKPLSQGQFGQYPLYAFTDEGVWALSISDNGTFSARQPITRHTLASPHAICTLDSSVAFIAPQGLILLSGSQASHLSHPINSIAISSFTSLKGLPELLPVRARYILPLSLFLKAARIAYDSINSRIILYRPIDIDTYAYIYNLRSQQWTLMFANIHHTLNSYPHTYAVDTYGAIIKPFRSSPGDANIAIITRPLKLDLPDALKTIRQLYIRGQFTPGHIQCALYGSRDLKHWHLIASSRDHRIRRISGTPYKYHTIAVLGKLSATESITSAQIDYIPRYTNRLR